MSKSIDVQLSHLKFPSTCMVCMSPAAIQYELQKIASYGRRSYTVIVNVPMCTQHSAASKLQGDS